jgi:hypothetical protein
MSSAVGLPSFVFVRVSDGKEFSMPPGLYGDDWDAWYQPASGRESFSCKAFVLPAGRKIHLLHGDLRETVVRARKYCQTGLDKGNPLTPRALYEEIVKFADDFLRGGSFDIHVRAYSASPVLRIVLESRNK